jgi:hypothetical protein
VTAFGQQRLEQAGVEVSIGAGSPASCSTPRSARTYVRMFAVADRGGVFSQSASAIRSVETNRFGCSSRVASN